MRDLESACNDAQPASYLTLRVCLAHEQLSYDDLLRIVELIKSSEHFSEFRLKVGDIEVELRRRNPAGTPTPRLASAPTAARIEPAVTQPMSAHRQWPWRATNVAGRCPLSFARRWSGRFIARRSRVHRPFVEVGQRVEPATIVCIVEVMKLMNSVAAGVHGTVQQILVGDAAPVQAGQPLIVVQPNLTMGTDEGYE